MSPTQRAIVAGIYSSMQATNDASYDKFVAHMYSYK